MADTTKKLTPKEIEKRVKALSSWTVNEKGTQLSKTIPVSSFVEGLSLIARIAVHAEILNHHPDIELSYTKVKVKLTTHDAKGLSSRDFELAKRIENIQ